MASKYRPDRVRAFFDELGEDEWTRFDRRYSGRTNLELHRRLLRRWIPGGRVLEVGAGPGRFTIELATLGATVVVTDISATQLELNRRNVADAGCEAAVEARQLIDVVDLSMFPDLSFDAVTALGGPLSYVMDGADVALREMARVAKVGAPIVVSVMSRWGSHHQYLEPILQQDRDGLRAENDAVIATGDLLGDWNIPPGMKRPHELHLYTCHEVEELAQRCSCEIVDASASGFLSIRSEDVLASLDDAEWHRLLDLEGEICRSPGLLEAGTHLMVAMRYRDARAGPETRAIVPDGRGAYEAMGDPPLARRQTSAGGTSRRNAMRRSPLRL